MTNRNLRDFALLLLLPQICLIALIYQTLIAMRVESRTRRCIASPLTLQLLPLAFAISRPLSLSARKFHGGTKSSTRDPISLPDGTKSSSSVVSSPCSSTHSTSTSLSLRNPLVWTSISASASSSPYSVHSPTSSIFFTLP